MAGRTDTKLVLAGIEASYATDPTLTEAANAILTTQFRLTPLQADGAERNLDTPDIGNSPSYKTGLRVQASYQVEAAGSGTPGTPPKWGVLLRGAGMSETIDATPGQEKVIYAPITDLDTAESIYQYLWWGGTRHKIAGSRCSAGLEWRAGQIPVIPVETTGLFGPVTDTPPGSPDYSGFLAPAPAGSSNTPVFTMNGVALALEGLTFRQQAELAHANRVGVERITLVRMRPTLEITVEAAPLSSIDPFSLYQQRAQVPVVLQHGTAAGNIVEFQTDSCELDEPQYEDLTDGRVGWRIPLRPIGSAWRLIVR